MSSPAVSILVVDDDPNVLKALSRLELGAQFALRCCSTTAAARAAISRGEADVALVDQHLGADEPRGLDFLAELRERDPDCFRIIFTGAADLDFAVNAINHGRIDAFLLKPWSNEHLVALLNQGGETSLLRRHNRQLGQELSSAMPRSNTSTSSSSAWSRSAPRTCARPSTSSRRSSTS